MNKRNMVIQCLALIVLMVAFTACESTRKQESSGEFIDDSVITGKVKALFAEDDFFKSFRIGVETFKGVVQLSGFVNSKATVNKAEQITLTVQGVKSVKNNLIVK